MLENFKNWKTTLLGILTAVITILVSLGLIDSSQSDVLHLNLETIVTGVSAIGSAVASIWLMFKSKDKDPTVNNDAKDDNGGE